MLFNLFVADLDSAVECTFTNFVDDTNFCDMFNTVKRRDATQRDPDKLQRWVCANLIMINKATCKDIHMSQSNACTNASRLEKDNALPHSDGHLSVDAAQGVVVFSGL